MTSQAAALADNDTTNRLACGPALVLYIAAGRLLAHLLTAGRYGIFRDEMYYLACAEHPAWGYVDHPPMGAWIAWIARNVFGESLLGLRFLPAVAGAATVWITGRIAKELGGGRFAQALAALAVAVVPVYLTLQHWLTMNAFEPLIWMGCILLVLRAVNTGDARYWLWLGVLAGIGFETKYSIAFVLLGLVIGILMQPERRLLKSRYVWLGALACAVIALPNFLWQAQNHFPFLELTQNVLKSSRNVVRAPVAFIADQAMILNPVLFPLWAGGLIWLFMSRKAQRFRILGWTFVTVLTVFMLSRGKNYYVVSIYPMLFAAGAVGFESLTRQRWVWSRSVYITLILVSGALSVPLVLPILSPESFVRYQKALGVEPSRFENQKTGVLPQHFADEFGWPEMVEQVARVYNSLPPEERARTTIFSNNWGDAAAVDFFGPRHGLPKAISSHNTYWHWGPGKADGGTVIVLHTNGVGDREHFASVEAVARVEHPYARRDECFDLYLCRGLTFDMKQRWPKLKHYD